MPTVGLYEFCVISGLDGGLRSLIALFRRVAMQQGGQGTGATEAIGL